MISFHEIENGKSQGIHSIHVINHMVKMDYLKRLSQGMAHFFICPLFCEMSKSLSRTFNLELIFSELF